ncbi:MAG TPA: hypothetical protein VH186_28595 [Chloroflexia bacterium]|nr:hypothetical protein [Chloroflexia bacterium]
MKHKLHLAMLAVMLLGLGFIALAGSGTAQAADSQYFPQTNHTLSGKFLDYWRNNGGLAAFGYPITDAQNEPDSETGQVYLTQWFERNSFQLHPEFAGTKYEVELGLLGKRLTENRLENDPSFQPGTAKAGYYYFPQTQHYVSPLFYRYWQQNGSLDRLGFPIDEEQRETDPATGKIFLVQWFERARMEYHPENPAPYNVELGLLGNEIKYSTPGSVLHLFYQSINNKTFEQAYNYWDNPTQSLPAYQQWVQGYSDTASVALTTGSYQIGVGAGNAYANVPVVLVATHTNGSQQTFYGCYTTHKVNIEPDQPWFISSASIQQATAGASTPTLLQTASKTCANR